MCYCPKCWNFLRRNKVIWEGKKCSLRDNPKFLKKFRPKNNTLKDSCWLCNSDLAFNSKTYFITSQNLFHKRKFPKIASKIQVSFVKEAPGTAHFFNVSSEESSLNFPIKFHYRICVFLNNVFPLTINILVRDAVKSGKKTSFVTLKPMSNKLKFI
jgi:hypothetical protein